MIFQRFSVGVCLLLCSAFGMANSAIDVKLSHNSIDKLSNSLYVDIKVRVDNVDQINIAGQNYRIYFPSDKLSLDIDGSKSTLSKDAYSDLQLASLHEDIRANGRGNLKFDQSLGFANLSVDLVDLNKGGALLSQKDGWVTMATLKFNIKKDMDEVSMIWGRDGKSETYATAFVEIAQWEAPQQTSTVEIDEYFDLSLEFSDTSIGGVDYEITVGPNPTIDFVELKSDRSLQSAMTLTIADMSGKVITSAVWAQGSTSLKADVSALSPGKYNLLLEDNNASGVAAMAKHLVVTR